jgi:ABC-2 type transport system permease protein
MSDWRTVRCGTWLGWQIESNWGTPWLFLLYVLVKPLASSLLLVCMYVAARSAAVGVPPGFLPFLYVSSACFMLIGGMTIGMTQAVVTDRESYCMLKFIRISPARLRSYLIGRGLSRVGQACVGAVLTVAVGLALFPEMRTVLDVQNVSWGWLAFYLTAGSAMLPALGLLLAGIVLNMARHGMFLSEGVAGTLYLLSGAVFPLDVLPAWLRPVSLALPPTYWLEGMRRSLLGDSQLSVSLGGWSNGGLALLLTASTAALTLTAHWFFRWSEHRAWRDGRYDETSAN